MVQQQRDHPLREQEQADAERERGQELELDRAAQHRAHRLRAALRGARQRREGRDAEGRGDEPERLGQHVADVEVGHVGVARESLQEQDADAPVHDHREHRHPERQALANQAPEAGPARREHRAIEQPPHQHDADAGPQQEREGGAAEHERERSLEHGAP